jgi:hypothetical protein
MGGLDRQWINTGSGKSFHLVIENGGFGSSDLQARMTSLLAETGQIRILNRRDLQIGIYTARRYHDIRFLGLAWPHKKR